MLGAKSYMHGLGFSTESVAVVAEEAGMLIRTAYGRSLTDKLVIHEKIDKSQVTDADFASHDLIMRELASLTPQIPIVSEETNLSELDLVRLISKAESFWLVDPLDGTKDFIQRTGQFCVSIALVSAGRPIVGYIYVPMTETMYCAAEGGEVWRRIGKEQAFPIHTRPFPHGQPVCLVSRFHQSEEDKRLKEKWHAAEVIPFGSAIKYCKIAEGSADVTYRHGQTMIWDTAAAQCILESAGGKLVDFHGMPLTYRRNVLVNPPYFAYGDGRMDWRGFV
jgi:3'(2'), 5'-bisphosphate nucleotidase